MIMIALINLVVTFQLNCILLYLYKSTFSTGHEVYALPKKKDREKAKTILGKAWKNKYLVG